VRTVGNRSSDTHGGSTLEVIGIASENARRHVDASSRFGPEWKVCGQTM